MNIIKFFILIITAGITFFSCSSFENGNTPVHQIKFFNGSSNNKLEVLDWGGAGKPILFLTGLGNSAHIYDDFAPKFTDRFHVYALTRRGFGASTQTGNGYDFETLTKDILSIIDTLHMKKVILIGHSIAGDEITKFASSYPNRIEKIIYLDAANDRTSLGGIMTKFPEIPKPTTEDSSSLNKIKVYVQEVFGISIPEDELRNTSILSTDGKYLKDVTPDSIIGAIIMGIKHPDYIHIKSPALSIYALQDSIKQFIPFYEKLDSINRKNADTCFTLFRKWTNEELNRFKNEINNGTVKVIKGAHHYIFISHPTETEKMIREFLQ